MCSICHYRGSKLMKSKDGEKKLINGNTLPSNGEGVIWLCRFCQEKQEQVPTKDDLTTSAVPMISPTTSFSSSDRSVSSCGDLLVDVNTCDGNDQVDGAADSAQDNLGNGLNVCLHQSSLDGALNVVDRFYTGEENNLKEINNWSDRDTVRAVEIAQTDNQEAKDNCSENTVGSDIQNGISSSGDEVFEAHVWEPPEAEDPKDDLERSVAFSDEDDDEYGDGTKWGRPSSLSSPVEEGRGSHRFKKEKQKAMDEVLNGKFKTIVSQLLKTEGVAPSGKDGANWVDIVTALSWEAASLLKPDAFNGKAIDPSCCVKVKCIATGSQNESQVIKGCVFKKRAAHKHMPTKYKNPRLLLIRGVLGQSSSGLSSFKTIEQENDNVKSIVEMIEVCHPNVVLVEKSVSRDVQESMLAKGMTLVYDMKLHRLERIARCTGSPILSSDALLSQKLKKCDSFHIEKYIEEHTVLVEGGKKPSKTLMFIEGCPTRLGCTILLKGSHSEELKRIKCVVQIAVIVAYHLILETSFLVDQNAMFSTIPFTGAVDTLTRNWETSALVMGDSTTVAEECISETQPSAIEVPNYDGLHAADSHNLDMSSEGNAAFSSVPYNPAIFSGFSTLSSSLKKVIGENFPRASVPYQSLSNYFGIGRKETNDRATEDIMLAKSVEASELNWDNKVGSEQGKSVDDGQSLSPLCCSDGTLNGRIDAENKEDKVQSKDDINAVLDSQSILVLMSSRNALRGTMCKQSRFSHIMFYRNFDVPLGKFLQDNLLNQRSQCSTCGELPEAHFYYYAHHDRQLTIRVKRLLKPLPGKAEGKLWMWSCCGKCKHDNGILRSTKRVMISTAARNLSFGKFLELSFCRHLLFDRPSRCGHSLERDFVYFFGLGTLAAMFKYSSVTTYFVSLPPMKLELFNSIRHEALIKDFEQVHLRGSLIFRGIADALEKLRSRFSDSTLNLRGSLRAFSYIEDMLKEERSEFELSIHDAVAKNGNTGEAVYKLLTLNRLLWELLLVSIVWERRLHSLLLPDPSVIGTSSTSNAMPDQLNLKSKFNASSDGGNEGTRTTLQNGNELYNSNGNLINTLDTSLEADEFCSKNIPFDGLLQESVEQDGIHGSSSVQRNGLIHDHTGDGNCHADNLALCGHMQVERTIPINTDVGNSDSLVDPDASTRGTSPHSLTSSLENSQGWFWMPLSEIRQIYKKDLQRGFMPKFKSISSYLQENIPAAYQLISEEGPRLHILLGNNGYIVRDYDGELSSIIACALAFLDDPPVSTEIFNEGKQDCSISTKSTDGTQILTRDLTNISPCLSSNGSSDSDSLYSMLSVSSEESHFSSFDGLNLLESLVPPENFSHEVYLGVAKSLGKGRYSVVCLYAKQFHDLRNRCCLYEPDYIASLSRCKNWDAKGGKSKSFFAKTLDDRFIIKEIKKTEFESFVKFAPHYFKYMNESFELGNQTCLAKVLGIYQVIIRQTKSGKERRHDLMVMENLTFGRNITRQYDLKGALHARFTSAADGSGDVLLDQNFVNDMNSSPLYVSNKAKRLLERAVWNDTTFLNSINVMDYSLLVGVDTKRQELVCGIIDYLRQFTWDKQLETWVKSSLVVPKNVLPTIISPREYKKRFRKFMSTHFLSVPDSWCLQRSSNCCELCGIRDGSSSHLKSQM